jgi:hypothetical protein
MVADSGTPASADRVRALNLPRPVVVRVDAAGRPLALLEHGQLRRVDRVQDVWRIDDEWWRDPISRRYLALLLADGALRTLFQDLTDDRWYEQRY